MAMQIPQFFINPIEEARNIESLKLANYQNVLAQQRIQDEEQKRAGYEAAYKNWLTPQQAQQAEVVEPTSAIQRLYGEQAQPVTLPQETRSLPQPYAAPEGSSYAYIQGANEANELFQKQQQEYYTQNIAPLMTQFIKTGDNENYQKLMTQLNESTNPVAGLARSFASMLQGSSVPTPGKVSRVPMTEELRQTLLPMAANPAIKAAIEKLPVGELADVDMVGDNITGFSSPREYGKSLEELELQRRALELRKRSTDLRGAELAQKYDPEVQGAVEESKAASKEVGKSYFEAIKTLPSLQRKQRSFDKLEQLAKDNPGAFGKFTKFKAEIAALTDPAAVEAASKDVASRRKLEINIRNLMDDSLKKMFGPPFSDSDLKIMFAMTAADLNSPTGVLEAIQFGRNTLNGEIEEANNIIKMRRKTTVPVAAAVAEPKTTERSAMIPTRAKLVGKDRRTGNSVYAITEKGKTFYFDGVTGKEIK